ncbi:uncharacterized protein LOC143912303 [Arctopsyche grandis]|uniref:uncharacterized protein LOC143912303 n=1 Tax=Arctopsyche grandis TaxID=121162 RepID=UPI00406D7CFF
MDEYCNIVNKLGSNGSKAFGLSIVKICHHRFIDGLKIYNISNYRGIYVNLDSWYYEQKQVSNVPVGGLDLSTNLIMFVWRTCIFILLIVAVEGRGPDPWDRSKTATKPSGAAETDGQIVSTSDLFYKRLLQLLVNRGRFKETDDMIYEGSLHFEFAPSEFSLLKKYSTLSVPFTSKELREIDGLLADRLILPSVVHVMAENLLDIVVRFFKNYYLHMLFLIGVVGCVYTLRSVNWTVVATTRSLLILFLFIFFIWECKLELEEADKELYEKITPPWWKFWEVQQVINVKDIRSMTQILHPVNILGKLIGKIIFSPMKEFLGFLDAYANLISEKFWIPFDSISYMFITMTYLVIIITIFSSSIFYLIFGTSFDFSYLGFRASMTGTKGRKDYSKSNTNDSIKDHNVKALIDMCSKLVDKQLEILPRPSNGDEQMNGNVTAEKVEKIECDSTASTSNVVDKISPEVNIRRRNLSRERNNSNGDVS